MLNKRKKVKLLRKKNKKFWQDDHKDFFYDICKKALIDASFSCMGTSGPNPPVACIITQKKEIISTATSTKGGGMHAEVKAIQLLQKENNKFPTKLTLWVSLEPCCHTGKNPPCCEKIVEAGIKNVNYVFDDPNPLVNGKGITYLKKHGVKVRHLKEWQVDLFPFLESFFHKLKYNKPLLYLKVASTIGGTIADSYNQSKWISSKASRMLAHRLRTKSEAILIGGATFLHDMPVLTPRLKKKEQVKLQKKIIFLNGDSFQKRIAQKVLLKKDINYPHRFIVLSSIKNIQLEHFENILAIKKKTPKDFLKQNGLSEFSEIDDISEDMLDSLMDNIVSYNNENEAEIDLLHSPITFIVFYKNDNDADRKWYRIQELLKELPIEKALIGEVPESLQNYYLDDMEQLVFSNVFPGISFYFVQKSSKNYTEQIIEIVNRFGKLSLLVEGGGKTLSSFLSVSKPGDKLYHFMAPLVFPANGVNMFSSDEKKEISDSVSFKKEMQIMADKDIFLSYKIEEKIDINLEF